MFETLKKFLFEEKDEIQKADVKKSDSSSQKKIEIAACALFIELAKADGEFSEDEKSFIVQHMKKAFNLDEEYISDLIELAEKRVENSISIYEFTGEINDHFTQEQKEKLLENLWRLIFTDEKLNAYEDNLIKKIGLTMNIEHKKIIEKKLLIKEELGLK